MQKVGSKLKDLARPSFFEPFTPDYAFHFRLIQLIGFLYAAWRLASRDYSVYGLLDDEAFCYPRWVTNLYPINGGYILSLQFLHDLGVPRPDKLFLAGFQWCGLIAACGGIIGVFPRYCAWICLAVLVYLTGLVQATNAEVDGGTLCIVAIFVLAVSSSRPFYRLGDLFLKREDRGVARSVENRWPVFLFLLIVSAFYTTAGINKLVDVGPNFIWDLHLENQAERGIEKAAFVSSRFTDPFWCGLSTHPLLSYIGSIGTLVGEIGFILILWLPRLRFVFVGMMMVLHFVVCVSSGINFLGSILILLLCLNWSLIFEGVMNRRGERNAPTPG